ncbi:MAG: VanZ family protein [Candidatus Latescibacterota bacterium]
MKRSFVRYHLPACAWATLIFIGSSLSSVPTPKTGLLSWDKAAHFAEFAIFGVLLIWAFRGRLVPALIVGVGWGMLDEIHQLFVTGRNSNVFDAMADALGVIAVAGVFLLLRAFHFSNRNSSVGSQLDGK